LFGFSNNTDYLSSSPSPLGIPSRYWAFRSTFDNLQDRGVNSALRLVRGTVTQPNLQPSADGQTVFDPKTGLEWRRCVEGMTATVIPGSNLFTCTGAPVALTHEAALAQATKIGNGWRVPNTKELFSIIDRSSDNSVTDPVAFPATPLNGVPSIQWSSTPIGGTNAWIILFSPTVGISTTNRTVGATVRLVRLPLN
jgi:Protein of unknown function (DUF1566)